MLQAKTSQRAAGVVVAGVVALALLNSGDPFPPGPEGTVIDKRSPDSLAHPRLITVRTPAGRVVEFDVTSDEYDVCFRGSHYPACAKRVGR